jgi:hypothetical protein
MILKIAKAYSNNMTAEMHEKPGEDEEASARGSKRGEVGMDEERGRERKSGRAVQA